jgi:hypothetical protein
LIESEGTSGNIERGAPIDEHTKQCRRPFEEGFREWKRTEERKGDRAEKMKEG